MNEDLNDARGRASVLSLAFARLNRIDRIEASMREGRIVFDRVNRGVTTERGIDIDQVEQELEKENR